jgi:hypothetical protein
MLIFCPATSRAPKPNSRSAATQIALSQQIVLRITDMDFVRRCQNVQFASSDSLQRP